LHHLQLVQVIVLRDVNFGQTGQNRFEQFVFVCCDHEEARVETELFDATPQGGLGVARQFVGVVKDNDFEARVANVGFREMLQVLPDELDALSVGAIDPQRVLRDALFVGVEYLLNEPFDQRLFATPDGTEKQKVGDALMFEIKVETGTYGFMHAFKAWRRFVFIIFFFPSRKSHVVSYLFT
jgi:hypothetical protein